MARPDGVIRFADVNLRCHAILLPSFAILRSCIPTDEVPLAPLSTQTLPLASVTESTILPEPDVICLAQSIDAPFDVLKIPTKEELPLSKEKYVFADAVVATETPASGLVELITT
jgi:hypothetical protein